MIVSKQLRLKEKGANMKIRQELRESRQAKKKTKMPQHGKSLAVIYKDVVLKKTWVSGEDGESQQSVKLTLV